MKSSEIRFQINSLLTQMSNLAADGFTSETRAKFDAMQKDVEQFEADEQRFKTVEVANHFERSLGRGPVSSGENETRTRLNKSFQRFMLNGEVRDLLTSSDVTGGALIPQEFDSVLNTALRYYGPIAQEVRQRQTDDGGRPLKVCLMNDTNNGLTLLGTEGTSSPAETDPAFKSQVVNVDTLSGGLVKVSIQEVQDSNFDIGCLLEESFALRYGRGLEKALTLGTDSAGTALPSQSTGGLLGAATVGTTTATSRAESDGMIW